MKPGRSRMQADIEKFHDLCGSRNICRVMKCSRIRRCFVLLVGRDRYVHVMRKPLGK
jgi:hypothetical protein